MPRQAYYTGPTRKQTCVTPNGYLLVVPSETRSRLGARQKRIMFDDHTFAGTGCAEACMEATRLGTDKIPQSHIPHLQFTGLELRMRAAGLALGVPTVQPDR